MSEENKGQPPAYRGNINVAAWKYTDKHGKPYLSVKLDNSFLLFKNEPKPKPTSDDI